MYNRLDETKKVNQINLSNQDIPSPQNSTVSHTSSTHRISLLGTVGELVLSPRATNQKFRSQRSVDLAQENALHVARLESLNFFQDNRDFIFPQVNDRFVTKDSPTHSKESRGVLHSSRVSKTKRDSCEPIIAVHKNVISQCDRTKTINGSILKQNIVRRKQKQRYSLPIDPRILKSTFNETSDDDL